MDFNEGLKKVLFASVGAVAVTAESAKELIDTFVEKGEKTVSQSKVVNEELKRNIKEKVNDHVTVHIVKEYADVMKAVDSMSKEELEKLKEKISQTEKKNATKESNCTSSKQEEQACETEEFTGSEQETTIQEESIKANHETEVPQEEIAKNVQAEETEIEETEIEETK